MTDPARQVIDAAAPNVVDDPRSAYDHILSDELKDRQRSERDTTTGTNVPVDDPDDERPTGGTSDDRADDPGNHRRTPGEHIRNIALTYQQVKELPPPEWLIEGFLVKDSLAMLYGPSGVGKSFMAADWALRLSRASWWQHRDTNPGPIVYVVAEGANGFGLRFDAWEQHNQMTGPETYPSTWIPQAVNLASDEWVTGLIELCAEIRPVLIVLDTLARCTVGAEENSAKEMGIVIANLDRIRVATGACVLIVHHTGKVADRGARGNSSLRGAMDTELELTGDEVRMTLKVTKQKDGVKPNPLDFCLVPVAGTASVALDALDWRTPTEAGPPEETAGVLDALVDIDVRAGVTTTVWMEAAMEATKCGRTTFFRHRTALIDNGLVIEEQKRYRARSRVEADEETS